MKLYCVIQATPSRARMVRVVQSLLSPQSAQVFYDESGTSWGGLNNILKLVKDFDFDNLLIMQDDIGVCADFIPTVEKIIDLLPNEIISFFSPNPVVKKAILTKRTFAKIKTFYYAQAYVLPRAVVHDFYRFANEQIKPTVLVDDVRLATYCMKTNRYVYVTIPSLVEHLGWNTTSTNTPVNCKPEARMAQRFIGYNESGLSIDWAGGLREPLPTDDTGSISLFEDNICNQSQPIQSQY